MKKYLILIVAALAFVSGNLAAEYRYVTDSFKIMMRTGESSSHKIKRTLSSGTKLELISTNPETGYSKVIAPGGVEGYVLTRQLLNEPVAKDKLDSAIQKLEELQAAPGELSAKLSELQTRHEELMSSHESLKSERDNLEQELSTIKRTASNAIRVTNERNELRQQVTDMTREVEQLKQENRELTNNSTQYWFMIGGGTVIVGILIGLILPHLRVQKRRSNSSWDSF